MLSNSLTIKLYTYTRAFLRDRAFWAVGNIGSSNSALTGAVESASMTWALLTGCPFAVVSFLIWPTDMTFTVMVLCFCFESGIDVSW